mmetsp:Transcript_8397/g.18112  ORF Transcript_8397/g.18112 Transcript_8397/m.18112 type:complete len:304 (+) Transcript_8397:350-1261(+)
MGRDDSLDVPLGNGVGKVENLNGCSIENECLQDRCAQQSSREGVETRLVVPDPVPRIYSQEIGIDIRPAFLESNVGGLDIDSTRGEEETKERHATPTKRSCRLVVFYHLGDGVSRVIQQRRGIDGENLWDFLRYFQHGIRDYECFRFLVAKDGLRKRSVPAFEGSQGQKVEGFVPFFGGVLGALRNRLGSGRGISQKRIRKIDRKRILCRSQPDIRLWELLGQYPRVRLVLQGNGSHHDVFQRTVLLNQFLEHVHAFRGCRHGVVNKQSTTLELDDGRSDRNLNVEDAKLLVQGPYGIRNNFL